MILDEFNISKRDTIYEEANMNTTECLIKLKKYNQEHIWKDFDQLSEVQKQALIDQIEGTDFDVIKTLEHKNEVNQEENIEPLEVLKMDDIARYKEQFYCF